MGTMNEDHPIDRSKAQQGFVDAPVGGYEPEESAPREAPEAEGGDPRDGIVYSTTEPCRCGEVHPV